ncbi:MAG: hypothetical protein M1826_003614 [Phylliscum demangeonii]|nr:MAG: hypothetical protein M1826_003614 [Phylliscum demangeonii]
MDYSPTLRSETGKEMAPKMIGHMLSPHEPDNPLNWPLHRKIYVSAVAAGFAYVATFGLTAYTAGITQVMSHFQVSMTVAVLPMSLYLIGIVFAPMFSPHLSERLGRSTVYLCTVPIFALFILGAGLAQNFATLAICRFLAGFFAGPSLVLIEGTFADVWSAEATVSYYAVLAVASYAGAASGPLIAGFVFAAKGWRWTQWVTLMLILAAYLLGFGLPETYPREILRRQAKRRALPPPHLLPAESGVRLGAMARVTILHPLRMLVSEPVVIAISLFVAFNFGVLFSLFIAIPVVLHAVYAFSIRRVGIAFLSGIGGVLLASLASITIDHVTRLWQRRRRQTMTGGAAAMVAPIESRLIPAMVGAFLIPAALFWIGWTAKPSIGPAVTIVGTLVYVCGNAMVLISLISYLFDAYPAAGTLSALTTAACLRLLFAAVFPLFIIQMITRLTGAWALSLFAFLACVFAPIPFALYRWGAGLRARSRYSRNLSTLTAAEFEHATEQQQQQQPLPPPHDLQQPLPPPQEPTTSV